MRIILAIAIVVAIPLTVFLISSAGPSMLPSTLFGPPYGAILPLLLTIFWPILIVLVIGLLDNRVLHDPGRGSASTAIKLTINDNKL